MHQVPYDPTSASASSWSWVTYTVVMRNDSCRDLSSKRICSRSLASRLLSGSSSNSTCGLRHQRPRQRHSLLLATAQIRRQPVAQMPKLKRSSRSSTLAAIRYSVDCHWTTGKRRFETPSYAARSHRTETPCRCGAFSGGTKMPRTALYIGRSSMLISPADGRSNPAMQRNVVVLPQPLGPSKRK